MKVKRGDLYWVNLDKVINTEDENSKHIQSGFRPCCVTQNNIGNKYSPTVTLCPCTSKLDKRNLPTHMIITKEQYGEDMLEMDTTICTESEITVNKDWLKTNCSYILTLNDLDQRRLSKCMIVSKGIKIEDILYN